MKIKELRDIILGASFSSSKNDGKLLFERNLVSNIKGKNIDGIYHIYGKVSDEDKSKSYNSHLKVDMKKGKLVGAMCNCEDTQENSKLSSTYLCKHSIATVHKFYSLAEDKLSQKQDKKELVKEKSNYSKKEKLIIDIKLKCIKKSTIEYYELELRIGEKVTYIISSLEEFLDNVCKNKSIIINHEFRYNPFKHEISLEDMKVLMFLKDYVDKNRNLNNKKVKSIEGRLIRLSQEKLQELLLLLDKSKKVTLNYEYLDYTSELIYDNLPIGFTLKEVNNQIVLTTKKKFPIALDNKLGVFLYDRKIYLPNCEQTKFYGPLYKELKSKGQIVYKKDKDELSKVLYKINKITKDIILDEAIRQFSKKVLTPKFYFERNGEELYCRVKVDYSGEIIDILQDKSNNYLRDYKWEEKISFELERLRFIRKDGIFTFIGNDEEVYNLLSYGLASLSKLGNIYLSKEFRNVKVLKASNLKSYIDEDHGQFYLKYNFEGIENSELNSIIQAKESGERFYKTRNNNFLDLEDEYVGEFLNLVSLVTNEKEFDLDGIEIDSNKLVLIDEFIKTRKLGFIRGNEAVENIKEKLLNRTNNKIISPRNLKAKLRDYQKIGYNWLDSLSELGFGGILADEMGLGKTIQTIAFLLSKKKYKSIVIVPTSLIYNWRAEFECFAPTIKVGIVHGDKEVRDKVIKDYKKYDVILTSYGTLKNDIFKYSDKKFNYCIIDEAQNIKNHESQITKVVKSINAECRIALTGTPIENNLMELWSIFDFLMPGFLYDNLRFKKEFIKNTNQINILKSLINPFILRREKKDVAKELPDKIEKKYLIEMTDSQKQIYKSYIKEVRNNLSKGSEDSITVFSYLTKLRQLCLDPSLIVDGYEGGSGKLKEAVKITKSAVENNKKILLFSQFTSVLKNIGEEMKSEGIRYVYLDGATPAKERVKLVNEFNENNDIKVFLISLKAGGTGLNLTSANLVIHFDPWWNPAIENQATDRAHRIGQKNIVEVIKLIAHDSIEEKITMLQEDKKKLIDSVMSNENMNSIKIDGLTNEEIINLFK